MKATFPAVFEKYLTGQAVHIPKVSACHFIFVEEFQKSIYKGNINLNPDHYAGQSKEVRNIICYFQKCIFPRYFWKGI